MRTSRIRKQRTKVISPMGWSSKASASLLAGLMVVWTSSIKAECLGLAPPAPQNLNVCEELVERLVVPAVFREERSCDVSAAQCALGGLIGLPIAQCCLPGVCLVDPICYSTAQVLETASYVLNAGDLYCDFREIEPEEMIEKLRSDLYPNPTMLTLGAAASPLYIAAGTHIDMLSCSADPINSALVDSIEAALDLDTSVPFASVDMSRARIVEQSFPLASLYLRDGYDAITLDDVIVINDSDHDILSNWNNSEARNWLSYSKKERQALALVMHELVHVKQYRQIGRVNFVNAYLVDAVRYGYSGVSFEQDAYAYSDQVTRHIKEHVAAQITALLG